MIIRYKSREELPICSDDSEIRHLAGKKGSMLCVCDGTGLYVGQEVTVCIP